MNPFTFYRKRHLFIPLLQSAFNSQKKQFPLTVLVSLTLLIPQNFAFGVGGGSLGSEADTSLQPAHTRAANTGDTHHAIEPVASKQKEPSELKPFFRRGYLVVDPQSFEELREYSEQYKSFFSTFSGGIWVKDWKPSDDSGSLALAKLLCCFNKISALKITGALGQWDVSDVIERVLPYQENLDRLKIVKADLTDKDMTNILKSLQTSVQLRVLDLRGNKNSEQVEAFIKGRFTQLKKLKLEGS